MRLLHKPKFESKSPYWRLPEEQPEAKVYTDTPDVQLLLYKIPDIGLTNTLVLVNVLAW